MFVFLDQKEYFGSSVKVTRNITVCLKGQMEYQCLSFYAIRNITASSVKVTMNIIVCLFRPEGSPLFDCLSQKENLCLSVEVRTNIALFVY